jgi:hypothetical protein
VLFELADLLFEPVDLGLAQIGDDAGLAELIASSLELLLQVQVGGVEGGAGDTAGAGEVCACSSFRRPTVSSPPGPCSPR